MAEWPRVECPECGKEVAAYVPRDGDGSRLRPRKHLMLDTGIWCHGRFALVDAAETYLKGELTNG